MITTTIRIQHEHEGVLPILHIQYGESINFTYTKYFNCNILLIYMVFVLYIE